MPSSGPEPGESASTGTATPGGSAELEHLAVLHRSGLITDDQFEAAKAIAREEWPSGPND